VAKMDSVKKTQGDDRFHSYSNEKCKMQNVKCKMSANSSVSDYEFRLCHSSRTVLL